MSKTKNSKKEGRKKKRGILVSIIILFFKAVWGILKGIFWVLKFIVVGIYNLIKWIISKIKSRKKKNKDSSNYENDKETRPIKKAVYLELDEVEAEQGNFSDFKKTLYEKKSTIGLILGARGTGKSALGLRILENVASKGGRKVYAMGFKGLPSWIELVDKVEDVHNNSFLVIDESGISFSSRNFMSELNKFLSDLLLIARHKDLSVLFVTQNSANIDINIIRQLDYMLLKSSSLLQKDFERKKIAEIYKEKAEKFKEYKDVKGLLYVYADSYLGFASNDLPSFWSERVSKSFAK